MNLRHSPHSTNQHPQLATHLLASQQHQRPQPQQQPQQHTSSSSSNHSTTTAKPARASCLPTQCPWQSSFFLQLQHTYKLRHHCQTGLRVWQPTTEAPVKEQMQALQAMAHWMALADTVTSATEHSTPSSVQWASPLTVTLPASPQAAAAPALSSSVSMTGLQLLRADVVTQAQLSQSQSQTPAQSVQPLRAALGTTLT